MHPLRCSRLGNTVGHRSVVVMENIKECYIGDSRMYSNSSALSEGYPVELKNHQEVQNARALSKGSVENTNILKHFPVPPSSLESPVIVSAEFLKQPPDNLRKSNFFHFDISFYGSGKQTLSLSNASFVNFYDDPDEPRYKNGIIYNVTITSINGESRQQVIAIRLVDSVTFHIISYDGIDKNPDMRRVLLTHEVMCSRCCENKSCGNRNETPSDPVIGSDGKTARFHMKCNQNCLKNAGNPRETRRFKVMIFVLNDGTYSPVTFSENIFIHNNSKHGRKSTSSSLSINNSNFSAPSILHILPKEGRINGYEEVHIVGEKFFEGMKVVFNNQFALKTEFLNESLVRVLTPPGLSEGFVDVKIVFGSQVFQKGRVPKYRYMLNSYPAENRQLLDRLWYLLPKESHEVDPQSSTTVLRRCIEFIEYSIMSALQGPRPLQPDFNPMDHRQLLGNAMHQPIPFPAMGYPPVSNNVHKVEERLNMRKDMIAQQNCMTMDTSLHSVGANESSDAISAYNNKHMYQNQSDYSKGVDSARIISPGDMDMISYDYRHDFYGPYSTGQPCYIPAKPGSMSGSDEKSNNSQKYGQN